MATTRNWGDDESAPNSPRASSEGGTEDNQRRAALPQHETSSRFVPDPAWRPARSQGFRDFSSCGSDRRRSPPTASGQLASEVDVQALQLRLSLVEAQAGNQRLQLQIEQTRVQLQEVKNAGLLAALPLEQKRAEVRQLELQGRQAEISVKDKELELTSRKAALAAVHFDLAERQLHLHGDVAAERRAADEARLQAAKQRSEQQQQAGESSLPETERAHLARAVLQLRQQEVRSGKDPSDAGALLAQFGINLSSGAGFEFGSKSSSEADAAEVAKFEAELGAELEAELGKLATDDGSPAAAALSDGPSAAPDVQKPLDDETLARLLPGITAGAFWLSKIGEREHRLVYYRCSQCEDQHEELVSELGDLQVQKNLAAAADFKFVCEDCE